MAKGSARALAFEAGRAVPVYPPVAAGCATTAAAGALAASGRIEPGRAGLIGAAVLVVVVAAVGYKMLTGKNATEAAKRIARNVAWFVVSALVGFVVPAVLRANDLGGWAWAVVAALAGLWLVGTVSWISQEVMPPGTSVGLDRRDEARSQRTGGMAGRLDIWERASAHAARREIRVHRPSLRGLSWWQLFRKPVHEVGILVVRFGFGLRCVPWYRLFIWFEHFTLIFGGPRTGKTLLLAWMAYRFPGPLVTTSTRSDFAEWVQEPRMHAPGWRPAPATRLGRLWWKVIGRHVVDDFPGRAVHVWNPAPEIQVESTVRWAVLSGCDNYEVAKRRANDMIPDSGSDTSEAARWDRYARELLAAKLHAAALTNRQMRDVYEWLGDQPKGTDNTCAAKREIEGAFELNPDPDQRRMLQAVIAEHYSRPERTRGSVTFTATQALGWLASAKARELGDCRVDDEQTLDVRGLFERNETLHILGPDNDPSIAPLNRCLLGEIAYQARAVANSMPDQRLDPPALFALDEAGLVAKAPIHEWTADMGGRNVCIVASFQSESQMAAAMGESAMKVAKGNAGNIIQFGGSNDEVGLSSAANMAGEARYANLGGDQGAADSHTWKKLMAPSKIAELPNGRVYMRRKELRPVKGKAASILNIRGARRLEVKPASMLPAAEEARVLELAPSRAARLVAQIRRRPLEPVAAVDVDEAEEGVAS